MGSQGRNQTVSENCTVATAISEGGSSGKGSPKKHLWRAEGGSFFLPWVARSAPTLWSSYSTIVRASAVGLFFAFATQMFFGASNTAGDPPSLIAVAAVLYLLSGLQIKNKRRGVEGELKIWTKFLLCVAKWCSLIAVGTVSKKTENSLLSNKQWSEGSAPPRRQKMVCPKNQSASFGARNTFIAIIFHPEKMVIF